MRHDMWAIKNGEGVVPCARPAVLPHAVSREFTALARELNTPPTQQAQHCAARHTKAPGGGTVEVRQA